MDLSFGQIALILIVTMIAAIDQFSFLESIYRPIVIGPIIGAIMGDLKTGLMIGASYELMMIGAMPVGGAQPPNAVIGGIMATVFGISLNLDVSAALPLAIPFALLGQYAVTALFTVVSPLMVKADKYAEEANPAGIVKLNYLTMGLLAILFAVIVLVGLLAGSAVGEQLTSKIPAWVFAGLSAAGKMMPALGFGMLLRVMFSKELSMFLFLGFVFVAYMNLPLLAVALIGIAVAVYDFQINTRNVPQVKEADTDGI
jgi:PTS system N-acetylgalactosamine-specific IIC component